MLSEFRIRRYLPLFDRVPPTLGIPRYRERFPPSCRPASAGRVPLRESPVPDGYRRRVYLLLPAPPSAESRRAAPAAVRSDRTERLPAYRVTEAPRTRTCAGFRAPSRLREVPYPCIPVFSAVGVCPRADGRKRPYAVNGSPGRRPADESLRSRRTAGRSISSGTKQFSISSPRMNSRRSNTCCSGVSSLHIRTCRSSDISQSC